ncbi:TPA: M agglutinin-type afimbrial adhesin BmaE/AfaE-8, partial [Escherichia coli]|nr:M agglutinin-type afimbrial adhesin BmaE/AfaE-8 [Escherichia coli]
SYGAPIHNYAGDNLANGVKVGSGSGNTPFVVGTASRLTARIFGDQTLVPGVYRTTFELTTWTD